MAVTGIVIDTAVAGDDFDIERTITAVPNGQTLSQAWFTVKDDLADPDNNAIVQKVITGTPEAGVGQITDDGADGSGALVFSLTPTNTRAILTAMIAPLTALPYDIQIKTSAGKIYTVEKGQISVLTEVTLSSS